MILTETIYINKKPIGVIRRDDFSGLVAFSPNNPPSKLPDREYSDIDELKAALNTVYGEGPPDETGY